MEKKDKLRKEFEDINKLKPLWKLSEILPMKRDMIIGHISYVKYLEQQLKAKDELIEETMQLILKYQSAWEDNNPIALDRLMALFRQTEKLKKSLEGE